MIERKLLILHSAKRAKKPTSPGRRYKIGTKSIPNRTIAQQPNMKITAYYNPATRIGMLFKTRSQAQFGNGDATSGCAQESAKFATVESTCAAVWFVGEDFDV